MKKDKGVKCYGDRQSYDESLKFQPTTDYVADVI